MNIFVTGSNGFLGKYFRKFNKLREQKIIYGTISQKDNSGNLLLCENLYSNIERVLKEDIDVIIHFAAKIPKLFSDATYEDIFIPNITIMNNLYHFAAARKIKKFIYISSFGSMLKPETLDVKDFYTMSKIAGEHFCSLMESKGIQTASLRITSLYGEYSKAKNVAHIFTTNALKNKDIIVFGSGQREQNFIYAQDVVNAIELCIDKDVHGVYSIASKENTSMYELAKVIVEIANSKSKIMVDSVPDPQENYRPRYSCERAKRELGYEPRWDVRKGLERYVNWIKQNEDSFDF